jgi:hypothetical protein
MASIVADLVAIVGGQAEQEYAQGYQDRPHQMAAEIPAIEAPEKTSAAAKAIPLGEDDFENF